MTTAFDSFDESPLGAFVQSPLDARNALRSRVLYWTIGRATDPAIIAVLHSIYDPIRADFDTDVSGFTGAVNDYTLVIVNWNTASSLIPPWWGDMFVWSGRFLASFVGQDSTLPQVTTLTGLTLGNAFTVPGSAVWNAAAHPLMAGVGTMYTAQFLREVIGGTALISNGPIMQTVDKTDNVRAASYVVGNFPVFNIGGTTQFYRNLFTVPR